MYKYPKSWGKGYNECVTFRDEHLKFSYSLHVEQLWVSVLINIYCKEMLLWGWLNKALIYGYSSMLLGVILLLCSFSRTIVVDFLLGPRTYWTFESWPHWQCQLRDTSPEVGLTYNQKVVGYFIMFLLPLHQWSYPFSKFLTVGCRVLSWVKVAMSFLFQ